MSELFVIPGEVITAVSAIGGAPPTGYYAAKTGKLSPWKTKPGTYQIEVVFETGFATKVFLHVGHDANGNALGSLSEAKVRGRTAAIKQLTNSIGYNNEQLAQGLSASWLEGQTIYVEWHHASDLGAQYGEVAGFIGVSAFESFRKENKAPSVANKGAAASAGGGSTGPRPPAPSNSAAPVPPNGSGAPIARSGPPLPPTPSHLTR